jgi:NADH-quinone oxidoreductase subunit N
VLALFATLGMMVMISANHFLTVYLGLELLSLSLYAMVAMNRDSAGHRSGDEVLRARRAGFRPAALRHVDDLRRDRHARDHRPLPSACTWARQPRPILVFGLVFLVSGLAFKLGVVPFHMWIPTSITARRRR